MGSSVEQFDYLSDEWLAKASELTSGADGGSAETLSVKVSVSDVPSGDVTYKMIISAAGYRFDIAGCSDTGCSEPLQLTMDYLTAAQLSKAELSAKQAFLDGRLRIEGDVALLASSGAAAGLTDSADLLAPLRKLTRY